LPKILSVALKTKKPRTALVVDDSMLIRHTVCRFLEELGFEVEAATNGLQALEMLAVSTPQIIITDIQMPHMSGTALIDRVKEDPRTRDIPILILSGRQSGRGALEDPRAHAAIYKDIDIEQQLRAALDAALPPVRS
jgi:CheY-like chemotaxis protein